jgi:hypothetical protein
MLFIFRAIIFSAIIAPGKVEYNAKHFFPQIEEIGDGSGI